ncbi:hypothetical protein OC835_007685 [Tilletia horrida]|nr:hypothetical protein OC835_007685 [Tilletia horrida]
MFAVIRFSPVSKPSQNPLLDTSETINTANLRLPFGSGNEIVLSIASNSVEVRSVANGLGIQLNHNPFSTRRWQCAMATR